MRVGFAGAGNMAAAMARGWAGTEGGPDAMIFCDLDAERARSLAAEVGGETRETLAEIAAESDAVVLAVKPAALDAAADGLGGKAHALISVLAATSTERLASAFPGVPILRVMPNQPVEVGRGLLCCVPAAGASPDATRELMTLLEPLGEVIELDEGQIDAAMAVMSCSPAYVALVAEALAAAGAEEGLESSRALELATGAIAGTAELLRKREPAAILRAVAPPGGATEAGLEALERREVGLAFAEAVNASLERFR